MPDVIYIYTDGACIDNPGPGGFAGIIKFGATTYTRDYAQSITLFAHNMILRMLVKDKTACGQSPHNT